MPVHLHVGVPRSGSSAIQEFCRLNPDLLARFGAVYPALPAFTAKRFAKNACNGASLSYYLRNEFVAGDRRLLGTLTDAVARTGAEHVVISSEFLFDEAPDRLAALRDAFRDAHLALRVYVYIREPFDWLVSTYAQRVKSRTLTEDVNTYLSNLLPEVRFGDAVDALHAVFGGDLRVMLYRRDLLKGGDVRRDLFSRMGFDLGEVEMPPEMNPSANAVEIEAMRHLNSLIEKGLWSRRGGRQFLRYTAELGLAGPPIRTFVTREIEKRIRARFDPEVAALKVKHFPDFGGPLFAPPRAVERQSLEDLRESKLVLAIARTLSRLASSREA
jgi:hypothetical protein